MTGKQRSSKNMSGKRQLSPSEVQGLKHRLQIAIAAHRQGRLEEAEKHYAHILKILPDQPDALHMSGLAAHQQGKSARAVVLLKRAIAAQPNSAEAHNHLGIAHRKLGQFDEATTALHRAVEIKSDYAEAQNNLGNVLSDCGDLTAAADAYRTAATLAPHAAEPKYNLGNALRDTEQFEVAMEAYRAVLLIAPDHVEARFNLAAILERRHELVAASEELVRVLNLSPGLAPAGILMAKVFRRLKQFDAAEAALRKLDGQSLVDADAIDLAFEKGRLYDVMNRPDEAFIAFSAGNRKQAEGAGKSMHRAASAFRKEIAASSAWLQNSDGWPKQTGRHGDGLVFLVGFPRSGTTLLDQVLDAHPEVQVMEERPAVKAMTTCARQLGIDLPSGLPNLSEFNAQKMRQAYFAEVDKHVTRKPGLTLVDKMPLNLVHAPVLARIFPDARYLLALRHPLDVVLSNFMQRYRLNPAMTNFLDLDTAAQTYDLVLTLWHEAATVLALDVHETNYEDMVRDLENEAKKVLRFLDLPWTASVLDPAGHARNRKAINTPSYEQVAEPIYTRASGRWQRYARHLNPACDHLAHWVERLGYTQNGSSS